MTDYKFEGIIIAETAGDLLKQLESIADETPIKPEGGLWAGISKFELCSETFIDAFDHTVYQHDVYEPTAGEGEFCFGLYRGEAEDFVGYHHVSTAGELKKYLREEAPAAFKAVSVDDNFELEGAITEKVKFLLIRRDELTLEFK